MAEAQRTYATPPIIRASAGPVDGGLAGISRDAEGNYLWDAKESDVDATFDGVHFYHVLGERCTHNLPPYEGSR